MLTVWKFHDSHCNASPSTLLEEDLRLSSDSEDDSSPRVQDGEVRISLIQMKDNKMKFMKKNAYNRIPDAKFEPPSLQARLSSSDGRDPRSLSEVVARIRTKERPAGEFENISNKELHVYNPYLGFTNTYSKLEYGITTSRPMLTGIAKNSSSYIARSKPRISVPRQRKHVRSTTKQHNSELLHEVNKQLYNLEENNANKSTIGSNLLVQKASLSYVKGTRRRIFKHSQTNTVAHVKSQN